MPATRLVAKANLALGLPEDMRDYRVAAEMLLDPEAWRARLLTNNPAKIEGLERHGVDLVLDGGVEYPATRLRTFESEESAGCVTA